MERVEQHFEFLCSLIHVNKRKRNKLIKEATPDSIKAFVELVINSTVKTSKDRLLVKKLIKLVKSASYLTKIQNFIIENVGSLNRIYSHKLHSLINDALLEICQV